MPFSLGVVLTRSGHPVVRAELSGEICEADAISFLDALQPGGPYDGHGFLIVGRSGVHVDGPAKRRFAAYRPPDLDNPPPIVVVFGSAMLRLLAEVVTRATGNTNLAMEASEATALEALDGRMGAFRARWPGPGRSP